MKISQILPTMAAAILLSVSASSVMAADMDNMEKCQVMKDGKNIVKVSDGTSTEPAWVWVPKGDCAKYNAGDFSSVTPEVKAKLDM